MPVAFACLDAARRVVDGAGEQARDWPGVTAHVRMQKPGDPDLDVGVEASPPPAWWKANEMERMPMPRLARDMQSEPSIEWMGTKVQREDCRIGARHICAGAPPVVEEAVLRPPPSGREIGEWIGIVGLRGRGSSSIILNEGRRRRGRARCSRWMRM